MGGGAWWATVHEVTKSRTRLSDFTHSLTHSLTSKRLHTKGSINKTIGEIIKT